MWAILRALGPLGTLGVAFPIVLALVWGFQDWRLRGERIETLKVKNAVAGDAVRAAAETNRQMNEELEAADRRQRLAIAALKAKADADMEILRRSASRRAAAASKRGSDEDGPLAPVVLDWLQRVRRPAAGAAPTPGAAAPAGERPAQGAAGVSRPKP